MGVIRGIECYVNLLLVFLINALLITMRTNQTMECLDIITKNLKICQHKIKAKNVVSSMKEILNQLIIILITTLMLMMYLKLGIGRSLRATIRKVVLVVVIIIEKDVLCVVKRDM